MVAQRRPCGPWTAGDTPTAHSAEAHRDGRSVLPADGGAVALASVSSGSGSAGSRLQTPPPQRRPLPEAPSRTPGVLGAGGVSVWETEEGRRLWLAWDSVSVYVGMFNTLFHALVMQVHWVARATCVACAAGQVAQLLWIARAPATYTWRRRTAFVLAAHAARVCSSTLTPCPRAAGGRTGPAGWSGTRRRRARRGRRCGAACTAPRRCSSHLVLYLPLWWSAPYLVWQAAMMVRHLDDAVAATQPAVADGPRS